MKRLNSWLTSKILNSSIEDIKNQTVKLTAVTMASQTFQIWLKSLITIQRNKKRGTWR